MHKHECSTGGPMMCEDEIIHKKPLVHITNTQGQVLWVALHAH